MTLLLDSHVVLWWLAGSRLLSGRARSALHGAARLLVSPLSCWEIAVLASKGRIALDDEPYAWTQALFRQDRVVQAPLTPSAAVTAAMLDPAGFPGDPVDRLLYATARELGVSLVTRDRALRSYARQSGDVRVIW